MRRVMIEGARDSLLAAVEADFLSNEVCEELVRVIGKVAPFEWSAVMTTDPATLLPSGGCVAGFSPEACEPFWENELLDPDYNKFVDLARRMNPVATLMDAVDGDLFRSPRFVKLYHPIGGGDELRVAFTSGGSCLAVGAFLRAADHGPFTGEEVADISALVPLAARALRTSLGRFHSESEHQAPVVLIVNSDGSVQAMSQDARAVLDDLRVVTDEGETEYPVHSIAATKARSSRTASQISTRLRGRSGRNYRLQVSPMEGSDRSVAVTIQAARPDDIAASMLHSYELTDRETEIALWLCRGLSTKEIASELLLSVHTVRDYVKAIYEKAGVNSRGELVANLFSDHVLSNIHTSVRELSYTNSS